MIKQEQMLLDFLYRLPCVSHMFLPYANVAVHYRENMNWVCKTMVVGRWLEVAALQRFSDESMTVKPVGTYIL